MLCESMQESLHSFVDAAHHSEAINSDFFASAFFTEAKHFALLSVLPALTFDPLPIAVLLQCSTHSFPDCCHCSAHIL